MRKVELDNFKSFLKENDALLYYKLWIDIERLKSVINEPERVEYVILID